jgi:uncharacterized protein YdeI (YjbR/CyaY-like superfamily)
MLLISPRKITSAWSALNKAHVARAIESGAMTDAGYAKIVAAQTNGMWTFLDDVERLEVPADLTDALSANPPAATVWEEFPRSVKRGTLEWIKQAKRPETRARRIVDTAENAKHGNRPPPFRSVDNCPVLGC